MLTLSMHAADYVVTRVNFPSAVAKTRYYLLQQENALLTKFCSGHRQCGLEVKT